MAIALQEGVAENLRLESFSSDLLGFSIRRIWPGNLILSCYLRLELFAKVAFNTGIAVNLAELR